MFFWRNGAHTDCPYSRCGRTKAQKSFLNDDGSRYEKVLRMRPTIPLATLTLFDMCSSNVSSESIVIPRSFSMKITQIECSSLAKAESGCLQYFTSVSGQITSFNYNDASGLQISNTDYAICVRREKNFCGIRYSVCPDQVNSPAMSFSISSPDTANGEAPELSKVGPANCAKDWLTINCVNNREPGREYLLEDV